MAATQSDLKEVQNQTVTAIAWCLAWGEAFNPRPGITLELLQRMRKAVLAGQAPPAEVEQFVRLAHDLFTEIGEHTVPATLEQLKSAFPEVWAEPCKIGLVYGGATKIKQYVFEAAKLQDIRGASALLDRINLVDLPAFFGRDPVDKSRDRRLTSIDQWLDDNQFGDLKDALIPELIVYSTGGNILAFCPAALVNKLANAIEKRYTEETLIANSCAVGGTFRLLEIRFGLLKEPIENTFWFDKLQTDWQSNPVVRAYFGLSKKPEEISDSDLQKAFAERKNFNELVGKLATQFNLRRSGFDKEIDRCSRRYPPMLETHPYLRRDDSDLRNMVQQVPADELPDQPKPSDPLARKRIVGQVTKREDSSGQQWYFKRNSSFHQQINGENQLWKPRQVISWVTKFKGFLKKSSEQQGKYYGDFPEDTRRREQVQDARSLREISDVSDGFVAYIYADGNNMGQHIRDQIKTPHQYQQFSEDIFAATEQSVYYALAQHLKPHHYTPDAQSNRTKQSVWIHSFEIVTIGGDDVLLIVPANKALDIAKTIGERFEELLVSTGRYPIQEPSQRSPQTPPSQGGRSSL